MVRDDRMDNDGKVRCSRTHLLAKPRGTATGGLVPPHYGERRMRGWLKSSQLTLNQDCVKVPSPVHSQQIVVLFTQVMGSIA